MPTAVGPGTYRVRFLAASGDVIDLSDGDRWIALARHGFGGMDFHDFVSRGVRQAGDTLTGLYANPRSIEVPIMVFPRAHTMNAARVRLGKAMNPDWGDGTLEYTDLQAGATWTMTVRPFPVHLDTAAKEAFAKPETLRWTGHDPLWYGPVQTLNIPVNGAAQNLTYTGDMPVGITITCVCPLTVPITIQNVAGGVTYQLVFSTGSYLTGNTIKVVSLFNKKSSVIYPTGTPLVTTDIFPNRGLGSIYWPLRRGLNVISITTGNGGETPTAVLSYQITQIGV